MEVEHYETLPVERILLPKALRAPVGLIHHFVRTAAEIAENDDFSHACRRARLADFRAGLDAALNGRTAPVHPLLFDKLAAAASQHGLPFEPFYDLVSAFDQDIDTTRYDNHAALVDYCRLAVHPIGRLLLHLIGAANPENIADSDAICTSLQLINFCQDVALDWRKGHVYLPLADIARFSVTEAQIANGVCDDAWRALMAHQLACARALMVRGAPLARRLPGRFGLELCSVVQGGLRVIERIEQADYDVFHHRPVLDTLDWCIIAARTAKMRLFGSVGVSALSFEGHA
ncbi:squalene synthase HpnC [Trinickia terrae]|uniref:Squalene synthase HpnC n=1 Tax=Trinickia terrae TaxID=2571161 RepID=A0A4U1I504_9BURK|nr:squalene synthase HpnC [Trinickia terrae]TKC88388.1 squalene synthase HpnC [Trinickia terrae]